MSTKVRILVSIGIITVITIVAWNFLSRRINQDISLVTISTDKLEYVVRDTAHISIHNQADRSIDIYCPAWCALGNFPTTVERFSNGQWQYIAGFCPSIEPLFGSGVLEGDYLRHPLSAKSSFELDISNFEALHIEHEERLRIVYYLGKDKTPIYSNEFAIKQ